MTRTSRWAVWAAGARALRGSLRRGEPGLGERARALPRLVLATLRGSYRGTTRGRLGLMALAVAYIVSPIDLLPDVLPLLGVADDAMVAVWLVGVALSETGEYLAWERGRAVVQGHVVR